MKNRFFALSLSFLLLASTASAECVNRFVARRERSQQVVTLLTGKLTFQEAQALAARMKSGEAPRFEWVNAQGKTIAKQVGDLQVVRPMPVGCDGKTSGVVVIASFLAVQPPTQKMDVRFDESTIVSFNEQAN